VKAKPRLPKTLQPKQSQSRTCRDNNSQRRPHKRYLHVRTRISPPPSPPASAPHWETSSFKPSPALATPATQTSSRLSTPPPPRENQKHDRNKDSNAPSICISHRQDGGVRTCPDLRHDVRDHQQVWTHGSAVADCGCCSARLGRHMLILGRQIHGFATRGHGSLWARMVCRVWAGEAGASEDANHRTVRPKTSLPARPLPSRRS